MDKCEYSKKCKNLSSTSYDGQYLCWFHYLLLTSKDKLKEMKKHNHSHPLNISSEEKYFSFIPNERVAPLLNNQEEKYNSKNNS